MSPSIDELLANATELITFPEVALRINKMVEDEDSSADDIGELISQDPALTVKLLKLSNSSYFGFRAEIETVSRAVAVLGTQRVRDLTLGICASNSFAGISSDILSMQDYWRHSVLCGLSAGALAAHGKGASQQGVAFTAGLLHDIGQLVLFNQVPELIKQALMMVEDDNGVDHMDKAEKILLGFDHAELGAALARSWDLPDRLVACIGYHHSPQQAGDYTAEASLIHIANSLAVMAEIHSVEFADAPPIDTFAWEKLQISPDCAPEVIDTALENCDEMLSLLTP